MKKAKSIKFNLWEVAVKFIFSAMFLSITVISGCGSIPATLEANGVVAAARSGQGTYYYQKGGDDPCTIMVTSGRDPVGIDAKIESGCQLHVETKLTPEQEIKLRRLEIAEMFLQSIGPYIERLVPLLNALPVSP